MANVQYFDTVGSVGGTLTTVTDIKTLGYSTKNDGGGAHYKRYSSLSTGQIGFPAGGAFWGLVPDGGVINPLQAGATGLFADNAQPALQKCIDFIKWWADTSTANTGTGPDTGLDSSQTAVKLVIPGGDHVFVVDRTGDGDGLELKGPITIEGEDRLSSVIWLKEDSVELTPPDMETAPNEATGVQYSLFYTKTATTPTLDGLTFRNLTIRGSYGPTNATTGEDTEHGLASLFTFNAFSNVLFENMVFKRNRAVMIGGDGATNFTMRGCLLSECRRGGVIINDAENVVIEDNDFRWISDDPVAITIGGASGDDQYRHAGGLTRIVGNRCFGTRGLNVVGTKNVIIADNTHVLGRGRAIHVGCTSDQDKGDTTTLNVVVRNNVITDLLYAKVDPEQDQDNGAHRAIDIELLQAAPGAAAPTMIPGLPGDGQNVYDPTRNYYTESQGLNGVWMWRSGKAVAANSYAWWDGRVYKTTSGGTTGDAPPVHPSGSASDQGSKSTGVTWTFDHYAAATPPAANLLIEGNIVSRSRPPAIAIDSDTGNGADHVTGFNSFDDYGVGPFNGFDTGYHTDPIEVAMSDITPKEGIAVSGSVRGLIIRGNQVRNCNVAILFHGEMQDLPFSLLDVTIVDNDLSDWKTAGIRFENYAPAQPQRVSILDNRADGDPFHWNRRGTVRKNSGQWADTRLETVGATSDILNAGVFVDGTGVGMITIAGNHVRNVSQLVAGLTVAGVNDTLHIMRDNVGYCNPTGLGWKATNVGIGTLIEPARGWRYVIEYGDPTSSTYGKLINTCPPAVTAMPSSGTWVQGTIVQNLSQSNTPGTPAAGSTEVSGWRRMTTGSANVLNTDWREQRVLIV